MDCDNAIFRVYEYLDGELTVWRRRAITRHLDECPPCAQATTSRSRSGRSIVSKCREEAPERACGRKIAEALGIVTPDA